ncbi:MAG: TerB family tellurite resistance protein [Proteobacteria bacterium]|nr:TerB family tellurite resistance protein [Pseudomonadota bacterium]
MAAIVPNSHHPALDISEAERIDYLIAVASMAAADHHTTEDELERLRDMCTSLELSDRGTEQVMAAARSPDGGALEEIVDRLSASQMRYALLVDAVAIACADRDLDCSESGELMSLADKLDIPRGQAALVFRYVDNWRVRGKGPSDAKTTANLVGAGIPVAALAVTAAAGASLATGVGLAAALGVSSYMSVKWLFRHGKNRKAKRRRARQTERARRDEQARQAECDQGD